MITVTNRKHYFDVPFGSYVDMGGFSFSSIKNDFTPIEATKKMRFGSLVDTFLFTPAQYDGTLADLVRPMAYEVKKFLGPAFALCQAQVSCQADYTVDGLTMTHRGRPDMVIPKQLIIDLKVSELPLIKAIEHFRYDWQQTGYLLDMDIQRAIILSIHPKTKKISTAPIIPVTDWWEHQVRRFGKPLLKAI